MTVLLVDLDIDYGIPLMGIGDAAPDQRQRQLRRTFLMAVVDTDPTQLKRLRAVRAPETCERNRLPLEGGDEECLRDQIITQKEHPSLRK